MSNKELEQINEAYNHVKEILHNLPHFFFLAL